MTLVKSVAIGAVLCAVGVHANAGFYIEGSPTVSTERTSMGRYQPYETGADARFRQPTAPMTPKQARYGDAELLVDLAYKSVTQIGTGRAEIVDGFAEDVPFATAMSMIVPSGWQIYKSKSLEEKAIPKLVGYAGGKPWPDVLGQVADRYALQFNIDWNQRTIMVAKGRESAYSQASRIRVIPEPPRPAPAQVPRPMTSTANTASASAAAVASAAPKAAPLTMGTGSATSKPAPTVGKAPAPALAPAQAQVKASAPAPAPVVAIAPVAATAAPVRPVPPPVPVDVSIDVLPGRLSENVERLSLKQGWKKPAWQIKGDYVIDAGYTLRGKTFEEVMAKLLMLHPVEADINSAEHKIYVTGEIK